MTKRLFLFLCGFLVLGACNLDRSGTRDSGTPRDAGVDAP